MSDLTFPTLPGRAFPTRRTPIWQDIQFETTASGREFGVGAELFPRWQWDLQYDFLRAGVSYGELQSLLGFFNARLGQLDTFLYFDPDESTVTDQQFASGDASTTSFALTRLFGGFAEPVGYATPTNVKVNGVVTPVTLLQSRIVQFAAPPAAGTVLTWSGSYAYRCRFLEPRMTAEKFMWQLWNAKVSIISRKP